MFPTALAFVGYMKITLSNAMVTDNQVYHTTNAGTGKLFALLHIGKGQDFFK